MTKIKGIAEEKYEEPSGGFPMGGPDGPPPPPPSSGPAEYNPAVYIEDGKYLPEKSVKDAVSGVKIGDERASDIKILSDKDDLNGIYVKGGKSDYTLSNSTINLTGRGSNDFTGIGSGAMADEGATLMLENVSITTGGVLRCATAANKKSILRVFNSTLAASGGVLPPDYVPKIGPGMAEPPPPLGISGNCRAHLTMDNSKSYFYDSTIIADGWGALSTDASMGYVYLEANNCLIKTIRSGYGSYADGGCHDAFNECTFECADMAGIMAGQCDMTFNNCDAVCGKYFVMMHCVMGSPAEIGTLVINGGVIETEDAAILVKSHNAAITIDGTEMFSGDDTLIRSIINEDPNATKAKGAKVYGIKAAIKHTELEGNFIHEDSDRTMSLYLESASIKGMIQDASISLDAGSTWTATADSKVKIIGDVDVEQIDAPEDVTIEATAAESGTYQLASGGTLNIKAA